jgi:nitrate reductase cytochrome c-type subunit
MVVANSEKMLKESDETDTKQNKQKTKSKGKKTTSGSKEKRRLKSMRGPPRIPHVIFSSYSTDSSCHFCEVLHRFLMSF